MDGALTLLSQPLPAPARMPQGHCAGGCHPPGAGAEPVPTRSHPVLSRALRHRLGTPPSGPFLGKEGSPLTGLCSHSCLQLHGRNSDLISDQCAESESERGSGKTWEYQNSKPAW